MNTAAAIVLDTATVADIPRLVELLDVLFSIEKDFVPDLDKQTRGLQQLLARPEHAAVIVARHPEAGVIGMVSAQLVISTAAGAPSAWLEDLVIFSDYRGSGLGTRLLEAAGAWAASRGARRVQLLADAENTPALDFYRAKGWQATQLFAWRRPL
jgi:GNAT superfamily N-acetyltransferase